MMFSNKFKMKKKDDNFDEYVYMSFFKDGEYSTFVYRLNSKVETGFLFKRFVAEYHIEAYAVRYDYYNSHILYVYPTAKQILNFDNIQYNGDLCGVLARTPDMFSQIVGSIAWGVSKKYKAIHYGKGVFHPVFSSKYRIYK